MESLSALVHKFDHVFSDWMYRMNRIRLVVGLDHPVPRLRRGLIHYWIYEFAYIAREGGGRGSKSNSSAKRKNEGGHTQIGQFSQGMTGLIF